MDIDAIIRRGVAAERLLSDETVMTALGDIERDLITDWASSRPTDMEGREGIFRLVKALELFQSKLEIWRDTGKLEKAKLQRNMDDQRQMSPQA